MADNLQHEVLFKRFSCSAYHETKEKSSDIKAIFFGKKKTLLKLGDFCIGYI